MKRHILLLLVVICIIAAFLRFYKLGSVPYGFYQDESAIGYNAYSIIETGKDEYGKSYPLYFKSFGDHKLPVYIYSTIPALQLFGMNEFAVRFSSAFFGFLTVIAFYFFARELTRDTGLSLIATFLLSINPWHVHYNRATFEVSICLFLFVLGSYLLLVSFRKKLAGYFLAGTVCFILSLYAYNLTRLLSPALYVLLLWFFRNDVRKIKRPVLLGTGVLSLLLLLPFFITLFQSGGASSAKGTFLFTSAAVEAPLLELRSYFFYAPSLFTKLFYNMTALSLWQYLQNIATYFSVPFFFISGSAHGNHGIGNVGQFYLFELPFFLFGIYLIFREKLWYGSFLLLWAGLVIVIAALTRDVPHATRSFFLIVPFILFSAIGIRQFWDILKSYKPRYQFAVGAVVLAIVVYNFIYYLGSYFVHFPVAYASSWRSADKAVSEYIKTNEGKYDTVVFDKKAGFIYTSLLFYNQYPPALFQQQVKRSPDDKEGFSVVESFGKYQFRDIDWERDLAQERMLIITDKENAPKDREILQTFQYPQRPVVVSVKETLLQFPVDDVAYVAVESK